MKKSTLILVILALGLGAFVYFGEVKGEFKPSASKNAAHPAFASLTADEVTSLTIDRDGKKTQMERQGGQWEMLQPIRTRADQSAVGGIADDLAGAQITRTLGTPPHGMAAYGLDKPQLTVEFRLKNGHQHRIELGAKDFSGDQVYARVDGSKQAVLISDTLLTAADKSVEDLRDRSVLDVSTDQLAQFDLKNGSGEVVAMRKDSTWRLEKPRAVAADANAVDSLLDAIGTAKMASIVSETPKNLSAYGLNHSPIEFRARDRKGGEHTLLIGRESGGEYYARDTSRPMVFRVAAALHTKLAEKFFDLRNKVLVPIDSAKLKRVTVRNGNQTVVCEQQSSGKWVLDQPAAQKGKQVQSWRFLNPLETADATEILDAPPAAIRARLAHPKIEVTMIDQSGKTTKVSISAPAGGFVYARSNASPSVYKLKKSDMDDLNFKLADLMQ